MSRLFLLLPLLALCPAAAQDELNLEDELKKLMKLGDTPGMAVAILRPDHPPLVLGLGLAALEGEVPNTPQTRFAIGSSTKAFTALGLAVHVNAGRLEWDDRIVDLLPGFRLHDPVATSAITVEDLLTHRSGLPRHDLAWYGSTRDRAELIAAMAHLPANAGFRETWQYQNFMYMLAGHLSGKLAGKSWEEHLKEAVLEPLGMTSTLLDIAELEGAENAAVGHQREDDAITPRAYRALAGMGPAGSLCCSAEDLARWLQFWLDKGEVAGEPFISKGLAKDLIRPRIAMPNLGQTPGLGAMSYALGWMVADFKGHKVVFHGGDIDGFTAQVAFFPDDDIAIAAVSNLEGDAVPRLTPFLVAEKLLELKEERWSGLVRAARGQARMMKTILGKAGKGGAIADTHPSGPLADFAGRYLHPGYGQIEVREGDEGLIGSFQGQDSALSHFHYDTFRADDVRPMAMRLHFQRDRFGVVSAVEIPLETSCPPVRFTRAADPRFQDPEVRKAITGQWRVMLQPLEVEDLGELGFRLILPNNQRYRLKEGPGAYLTYVGLPNHRIEVRFDAEGQPSLVFHEPTGTFEGRPSSRD